MLVYPFAVFFFFQPFCISFLIRTVGGPSSLLRGPLVICPADAAQRLTVASQQIYMNGNQSGVDMWAAGSGERSRMRGRYRGHVSVNGHFQHLVWRGERERRKTKKKTKTKKKKKKKKSAWGGGRTGRGEKDVTMQSAPSAQPLRCGLAPSSQSQPDPHIAFIYLWKGVSGGGVRRWGRERERGKVGACDRGGGWCVGGGGGGGGGGGAGGAEEERDERVFCVYSHRVTARNFRPHKRFTFVIFADPGPM